MSSLNALPPIERAIVEIVAVSVESIPLTHIARALGKLGHRNRGHAVKNDEVLPLLRAMTARGLLSGDDRWTVPEALAREAALAAATSGRLALIAAIVRDLRPASSSAGAPISTWELAVRELRIELYLQRWDALRALARSLPRHIFRDVCRPFDRAWFADLPADLRGHALAGIVESATARLEPAQEAFAMLEAEAALSDQEHRILVEELVLRGTASSVSAVCSVTGSAVAMGA